MPNESSLDFLDFYRPDFITHIKFNIIWRCGYPCPVNFNPADFFIQTLAIQPGSEEQCLKNVNHICDSYEKSESAQAVQVRIYMIIK